MKVLEDGLGRFPDSEAIHGKIRTRILEKGGEEALEAWYRTRLDGPTAPLGLGFHAARAALAAGDSHRRSARAAPALAAYERAVALLDRVARVDPERRAECDRLVALVHAGRARVALQANDDGRALEQILASFARAPSAAGDKDGLGFTPGETAQMILARLKSAGKAEDAARLDAVLRSLDADLLRPDRE